MSGEDVDIRKNFDDKRKAGSSDENPEEGKEQKDDDQKWYELVW